MASITLIYGGNTRNSRVHGLVDRATQFFQTKGITLHTIYVHELPAEDLLTANFANPAFAEAHKKVDQSDGVIVVTPVYKSSYSGILKTYLDLLPQKGLEGKAVLPLVVGGTFGHLLTIDYALKPVLSSLGATTILNGVFVLDKQIERRDQLGFHIESEAASRLDETFTLLQLEIERVYTPLAQ
ncbi:NADPH-dependent FMN reductase [Aureibacillus halotolerans]|uniref:FMN reductase n=1 Tax=Aureibacillus halotolerans TaxID=1508390 RepID=A0A4R6TYV4_9BACI|nr:NADPH-dependent FMN reductase [Aureibacillus halotolerans]TDQ37145.1 FMN reductase [Aureibacillus halotolerans]